MVGLRNGPRLMLSGQNQSATANPLRGQVAASHKFFSCLLAIAVAYVAGAALIPISSYAVTETGGDSSKEKQTNMCFPHAVGKRPQVKGQVMESDTFGEALRKVAAKRDVRRILEIGTWYGGGSTQRLVDGLGRKANCFTNTSHHCCDAFVITFEIFQPAWEHARLYHQGNPVWLVLGTTVGEEDMLQDSEIPIDEKGAHYQLYYLRDQELMRRNEPQLAKYCELVHPNFVLIDGNEYTGWGEFQIVMEKCKPQWLGLHDTNTLKTTKVEAYIDQRPEQFVLERKGRDGASWSIFKVREM